MDAADRVEIRSVTCPANTPQSAPIETDLSFHPGEVGRIEIVIPAGHAYVTGLAIAQAHGIIIPASGGQWLQGDDDIVHWPVQDFLNNGSWSAFTYNTDPTYDHTWFLRFLVAENTPPAPPAAQPIPAATIQNVGAQLLAGAVAL